MKIGSCAFLAAAAIICNTCFAAEKYHSKDKSIQTLAVPTSVDIGILSGLIDDDVQACVQGVVLQGLLTLHESYYDYLKKVWCVISREDREISSIVDINDEFNAAISSGMTSGARLVVGNELLKKSIASGHKDAIIFVLSHELGHYRMGHRSKRDFASLAVKLTSLLPVFGVALKSKKITTIGLLATLAMYCSAFSKYKHDEISADRFAIDHLKRIGVDPASPVEDFLKVVENEGVDTIDPKCLSIEQISAAGSLSIAARNPHPYLPERKEQIYKWLGGVN